MRLRSNVVGKFVLKVKVESCQTSHPPLMIDDHITSDWLFGIEISGQKSPDRLTAETACISPSE